MPPKAPKKNAKPKAIRQRRSYTIAEKLRAIQMIKTDGVSAVAKRLSCSRPMLQRWLGLGEALSESKGKNQKKRLTGAGRKHQSKEVNELVYKWFEEQRAMSNGINSILLRQKASSVARQLKLVKFSAGRAWYRHFMRQYGLSVRMRTTMTQQLPANIKENVWEWLRKVLRMRNTENIHILSRMLNMDETPAYFDMPYKRTVAHKGEKHVALRTAGGEKKRLTVVLAVAASGAKLAPLVIFKGKRLGKETKVPSGLAVMMHESAWMSDAGMLVWLRKCLLPYIRETQRMEADTTSKFLMTMDMFKPHVTEAVISCLKEHKAVACIIPAGITSLVQPLDISINKPFKDRLRSIWAAWMLADGNKTYTKGGKMRPPSKTQVLHWVKEAWDDISSAVIEKSFKFGGISQNLDGSEDELIWHDAGVKSDGKSEDAVPDSTRDADEGVGGSEDDEREGPDSSDEWVDDFSAIAL